MITASAAKGSGSYGPIQESKIKLISCTVIAILEFVMKPFSVAYKIRSVFCRSSFQLYLWKFLCPEWQRWVINVFFVYKIKFGSPWVEAFLSWNLSIYGDSGWPLYFWEICLLGSLTWECYKVIACGKSLSSLMACVMSATLLVFWPCFLQEYRGRGFTWLAKFWQFEFVGDL